jgi:hypothetical protein
MTEDQARQMADSFDSVATSTSRFISANRQTLTSDQIYDLVEKIGKLHVSAASVETDAVGLKLANAQTSLTALKKLTADGRNAIKVTEEVGKVIDLLTALVTLAGAIAAKDPNGTLDSIVAVDKAIQKL